MANDIRRWIRLFEAVDRLSGSKVVGEDGEPLVVFHGTNAQFKRFEPKFSIPMAGIGFWFAGSRRVAGMVAMRKGDHVRIICANLDIKNPLVLSEPGVDGLLCLVRAVSQNGDVTHQTVREYRDSIIEQGYDGIVLKDVRADGGITDNYIAFDSDQIKIIDDVSES